MAPTTSVSQLGGEFDDFLFAPVGEEQNGMMLSVVSALARSDVDPWQEAAKLARLPRERGDREVGRNDRGAARTERHLTQERSPPA